MGNFHIHTNIDPVKKAALLAVLKNLHESQVHDVSREKSDWAEAAKSRKQPKRHN
jgi:hypothetical protein